MGKLYFSKGNPSAKTAFQERVEPLSISGIVRSSNPGKCFSINAGRIVKPLVLISQVRRRIKQIPEAGKNFPTA